MNLYANNLIRIASSIKEENPALSYELQKSVRRIIGHSARVSIVNPGVQTFEEHLERMVAVLQSLAQELETAVNDLNDASEFAKFFGGYLAEERQLKDLLNQSEKLGKVAASRDVAGFKDWFKGVVNYFKGEDGEADSAGMQPSYNLDEESIDQFVEGSKEWMDASQYIEAEFNENKDFFSGAEDILSEMEEVRRAPNRSVVESLLQKIYTLIDTGKDMLQGVRKHLMEPTAKVELIEDEQDPKPAQKTESLWDVESAVEHYIDVLRDNLGDEKKLVSLLKELYSKVEPALEGNRGEISLSARREVRRRLLPVLIRFAYARPHTRPALLPIIRVATGR